ncbi:MAG: hypothetical protein H6626_15060 [Pseudobdellovibrionaceae bacterium]|nr:hypothetical protein [Bdellovibrionales bacterium]USN47472.1 MAG: hypothetical protein H6626_15060 [Pseudobdellovibrionaceae bacterium]
MDGKTRKYLSQMGRKGGLKSRRKLTPDQARKMVLVRDARRAYRKYHSQCFWSYDPELKIGLNDVKWVGEQLMKHGGRDTWLIGAKLCR